MMADTTVVYYTGHRENAAFESRIQLALLDAIGDLPLISVSQSPISLGHNIAVGDVGTTVHNAWRQLQIGAREATTPYITVAESDYLYPKDYFTFVPPRDDTFYMPSPMYVLFAQTGRKHYFSIKPRGQEGGLVASRALLLGRLEEMFLGLPQWTPVRLKRLHLLSEHPRERFETAVPTVSFKTDQNMHQKSLHSPSTNCLELPFWGTAKYLVRKYL